MRYNKYLNKYARRIFWQVLNEFKGACHIQMLATIKMDWKEYENKVFEILQLYYPSAKIRRNFSQVGTYSKKERQVDIYIEHSIGGRIIRIYVECKYYNKNIDVKTVESFIAMASDLQADVGLMITEKGYSTTALKRAYYNPEEIELDILSLADLKYMQGHMAFPYAGSNAALLLSPFGWIIDASKHPIFTCTLYQRGLSFEEAMQRKEIAYINFWDRHNKRESLDDLLKIQEAGIQKHAESHGLRVIEIKYLETEKGDDAKTIIRKAEIEKYPGIELTGFIEFKDFIFFCVWFSDPVNLKRNIRKLKTMLRMTLPLKIRKEQFQNVVNS